MKNTLHTKNLNDDSVRIFLKRIGKAIPDNKRLYLLGGSALRLIGNARVTNDIDYTFDSSDEDETVLNSIIQQIARSMDIDAESVPIGEFIPLPPDAMSRRKLLGHFGKLDVYIYDLYSIAISKIARGFASDIEDVVFLLQNGHINLEELEKLIDNIFPGLTQTDIDPKEFQDYFNSVKVIWNAGGKSGRV